MVSRCRLFELSAESLAHFIDELESLRPCVTHRKIQVLPRAVTKVTNRHEEQRFVFGVTVASMSIGIVFDDTAVTRSLATRESRNALHIAELAVLGLSRWPEQAFAEVKDQLVAITAAQEKERFPKSCNRW